MAGGRAVAAFPLVAGGGPAVRRRAPEAVRRLATGLVVPAALLAGWQVTAANGWLPEQILPAPAVGLQAARGGLDDGSLLAAAGTGPGRVAPGLAPGGGAGPAAGPGV